MLKTIGVSRSGFYSYKKNENLPTQTQIRNEHLQKKSRKYMKDLMVYMDHQNNSITK